MNFDDAIAAHASWKSKLSGYLRKPDKSLNPSDVEVDDKCALGKWIHGDGKKWAGLPEYATLTEQHRKFHAAAAEVIRRADRGENVSEDVAIGSKSPFGAHSTAVVNAIRIMRQKCGS